MGTASGDAGEFLRRLAMPPRPFWILRIAFKGRFDSLDGAMPQHLQK